MVFGIYQIENLVTGNIYIGSCRTSFKKRWTEHINKLNYNKHENPKLQNAWNKYKEDNFEFSVIEVLEDKDSILDVEQFYLDIFPKEILYNIALNATASFLGRKHTEQTKLKMSEGRRGERNPHFGKTISPELKEKLLKANLGKSHSVETREKMRLSHIGEKNHNFGKHKSEETKQKLRESHIGKYPTKESRQKMSESHKALFMNKDK